MSIKRWVASQDTTITNAYQSNLKTRMTGSNMGASDVLEVFSIFGQAASSSTEASRILTQFPISQILSDRNASKIPQSGSVNFILRMFNAPHGETLPRSFTLSVLPVSRSWEEGTGLDMEEGLDITKNGPGANWIYAASGSVWSNQGGDYYSSSLSQSFDQGVEDLEIDISSLVETWISNAIPNYGVGIRLAGTQENQNTSYYTKRFFSRTSEFFFRKPILEARWNSSTTDDRGSFYVSSSLLSAADNTHTLYLYNYYKGQLKNIPSVGTGPIYMQVFTSASLGGLVSTTPSFVTGGYVSTGIYSASFVLNTTASTLYDIWTSGSNVYHTGSFEAISYDALNSHSYSKKYVISLKNLKQNYDQSEIVRLRLFTREKNWNPNIYNVAQSEIPNKIIENVYFKLLRMSDGYPVIDYGTGSLNHTKLSYDKEGNFFDLDMNLLESNYSYGLKFMFNIDNSYEEQEGIFKFKVN